ncbi:type VI secretion system tube protein Hcp [Citrobacter portucalensis]|uniref:Type VI secretion system tube protein TssD n=1 Tax=Citrobacter portucalensis TaxID=1639133 RepID=A0ABZ0GZX1_9ENTR|nr:type VI secretion system tube protein TssD [Citrobacter portucalensis]MBJ9337495.1 type VI secretion system tube protein Hcp [Citrobacter freundii]MDE9574970.1 type VI secretion system tube protein Hcp [Citrobacter portucalensis]MDE9651009.1 type VI secretion system tube protein Hcp [Citrobacter portucalensis]MDE9665947.1 type VI secretion system tube protein Hcp [Citrobacter portucalensis]MDE9675749.1 type VI secretion system tube protein Hcp [Citrobacter portucalensis]
MSNIVYLKLIGEQQADISDGCGTTDSVGNCWQQNHVNEIFVFSLVAGVASTGNGTNLQNLTFSKQIDKSSPLLMNAINNNENLFLEFWFYRINRYGQWERYYYIQLRGALISSIQMRVIKDEIHTETISVDYDYILSKHLISNTEFSYLALPAEYNKLFVPVPKPQTQTLNSAGIGRLLAAGGIYNGNIEGFRDTAEKLGGDAPIGFNQIINDQTKGLLIAGASITAGLGIGKLSTASALAEISNYSKIPSLESPYLKGFTSEAGTLLNAKHAVIDPKKMASYALNPEHPVGGNKARVFESALGFNPSNAGILVSRVQQGIISSSAELGAYDKFGQRMSVDIPIIGVNGETAIVRTGWMYETDSLVPRMTTINVK